MKKPIHVFTGIVAALLIQSCNNELSYNKAELLVEANLRFPITEDVPIQYGLIAFSRDSLPAYYYTLQQSGMFTIESLGERGVFSTSYQFRVSLTEEAKKFITKPDANPRKQGGSGEFMYNASFKTCEVQFQGVESIREIPEFKAAEIKYKIKRSDFTPFWKFYQHNPQIKIDTVQERKFNVMQTSEGWKPAHI